MSSLITGLNYLQYISTVSGLVYSGADITEKMTRIKDPNFTALEKLDVVKRILYCLPLKKIFKDNPIIGQDGWYIDLGMEGWEKFKKLRKFCELVSNNDVRFRDILELTISFVSFYYFVQFNRGKGYLMEHIFFCATDFLFSFSSLDRPLPAPPKNKIELLRKDFIESLEEIKITKQPMLEKLRTLSLVLGSNYKILLELDQIPQELYGDRILGRYQSALPHPITGGIRLVRTPSLVLINGKISLCEKTDLDDWLKKHPSTFIPGLNCNVEEVMILRRVDQTLITMIEARLNILCDRLAKILNFSEDTSFEPPSSLFKAISSSIVLSIHVKTKLLDKLERKVDSFVRESLKESTLASSCYSCYSSLVKAGFLITRSWFKIDRLFLSTVHAIMGSPSAPLEKIDRRFPHLK